MASLRTTSLWQGLAAVAAAALIAACADTPAPSAAAPPDARMGFIPPGLCSDGQYPQPICGNYGTVAGNGALSVELLEVCKVWSGSVAATPIQVRVQVRGGTVKDTVFTIAPGDGTNAQGNPIQCRELWMNGSTTPTDYVTVTEVLPASGYSVAWTVQTRYRPGPSGTAPVNGPVTNGTGPAVTELMIGGPNIDGALITFTNTPLGSIGDRVWNDLNGDGVQDVGEGGLAGWTVTLSGANNATTTTDGNGNYSFPNLPAGNYTVCVTPPAGYTQTYDLDGIASANCAAASLAVGQSRTDVDFGYRIPLGSIGDRVWNDVNGDGVQDAGEAGLAGSTVQLTNLATNTVTTLVTGPNGIYGFPNLPAGNYTVCVGAQAGWTATYDLDGIATPHCANVTLAGGQNRTDVDFGYRQLGSIGDRVWNDVNADGVQDAGEAGLAGWTVTLSGAASATTTTGANGIYSFPNLPAGSYTVCVTPAAGYAQTYDLDGIATANCSTQTLGAGQNRTDVDFAYRVPPVVLSSSIGNYAWIDSNGNGKQDVGEPSLDGVKVTLSGTASGTQTTSGGGAYLFTGLGAGSYTVTATAPAGYTFTTTNAAGTTNANDSNGATSSITLATNSSNDLTIDFGFVPVAGSGQGCTPGYWKQSQHFDSWKVYTQTDMIDAVFGVTYRSTFKQNPSGPLTLLQGVELKGNADAEQLFRHGTAALLNAVYQSGVSYPYTAAQVINMVRTAWNSGNATTIANTHALLGAANEAGCPLN